VYKLRLKHNQAGLSLAELVISITLTGIIAAALVNVIKSGMNAWRYGDTKMDLTSSVRRAIDKIGRQIREAGVENLTITPVDANHDIIEFNADIDFGIGESGDIEDITYELLDTGEVQETIIDTDDSVTTFVVADNITELRFTTDANGVVSIRMTGQKGELTVHLATKAWPRNS
jgi:hypothetical protein